MQVIYKEKIYKGMVELRDYELRRFLAKKEPLKIYVGEEYMVLSPSQLKKGVITNTQSSIFNKGQKYKLIGYKWIPSKNIDAPISLYNAYSAMPDNIRTEIRKKLGIDR